MAGPVVRPGDQPPPTWAAPPSQRGGPVGPRLLQWPQTRACAQEVGNQPVSCLPSLCMCYHSLPQPLGGGCPGQSKPPPLSASGVQGAAWPMGSHVPFITVRRGGSATLRSTGTVRPRPPLPPLQAAAAGAPAGQAGPRMARMAEQVTKDRATSAQRRELQSTEHAGHGRGRAGHRLLLRSCPSQKARTGTAERTGPTEPGPPFPSEGFLPLAGAAAAQGPRLGAS